MQGMGYYVHMTAAVQGTVVVRGIVVVLGIAVDPDRATVQTVVLDRAS